MKCLCVLICVLILCYLEARSVEVGQMLSKSRDCLLEPTCGHGQNMLRLESPACVAVLPQGLI